MSQSQRAELAGILFLEINGYLPEIETSLSLLQRSASDFTVLNEVYRLFHNIKGAASQVAYMGLSNAAAICEAVVADMLENSTPPSEPQLVFLDRVNGKIKAFCSLDVKSSCDEDSLLTETLSYFHKLMRKCGQENPIVLPEYLQSLISVNMNDFHDQDFQNEQSPVHLHEIRMECLASLRSIFPLLQELTDCSSEGVETCLPDSFFNSIRNAVTTLAECSKSAGLIDQHELLSSFLVILEKIRTATSLDKANTSELLLEFLSYLDLVFSLPPEEGSQTIANVKTSFSNFCEVLDTGNTPAPLSALEIQDQHDEHVELPDAIDVSSETIADDNEESIDFDDTFWSETSSDNQGYELEDPFTLAESNNTDPDQSLTDDEIELLAIFQAECEEHLQVINIELNALEGKVEEKSELTQELLDSISRMRRGIHTLKGAAAMTGFDEIATCAHSCEDLLDWLHDDSKNITSEDIKVIAEAIDAIELLSQPSTSEYSPDAQSISEIVSTYFNQRQDELSLISTSDLTPEQEIISHDDQSSTNFDDVLSSDVFENTDAVDVFTENASEDPFPLTPQVLIDPNSQEEELELLAIFQAECEEHLQTITEELNFLDVEIQSECSLAQNLRDSLSHMRRAVHTLKGAAAMTGFDEIAACAHSCEDLLDWLHDDSHSILPSDIAVISEAIDTIENLSQKSGSHSSETVAATSQAVTDHLLLRSTPTPAQIPSEFEDINASTAIETEDESIEHITSEEVYLKAPETQPEASVLPTDTGNVRVKLSDLDELVNIEGELVVARGSIEKLLDRFSESLDELNTIKDALRRKSQELEVGFEAQSLYGFGSGPLSSSIASGHDETSTLSEFDPIELDRYSQLNLIIRSLNEISIDVNAIYSEMTSLGSSLQGQVTKQQLAMGIMQEKLMRIRMTPLSSISRMLFRTVRQTAKRINKNVQLAITGDDVFMDRFIWSKTIDPMMHILRNCVDHGIEENQTRLAAGKPPVGHISINAEQRGRFVVLRIQDDGRGIDTDRLRTRLVRDGFIQEFESIGDQELLQHIFRPSVSTREDISQISGRGVGLDVVLRNIQELRGTVQVINNPGKGIVFELNIPITLSVNRAIIIDVSSQHFAVPIQDITEVRKFTATETVQGDQPQVIWNEQQIPLVKLAPQLQLPFNIDDQAGKSILTLVVKTEDGHVAMQFDRVEEQREIVIKDLGSHLRYVRGINGVTLTGEGDIIPILNLRELSEKGNLIPSTIEAVAPLAVTKEPLKVLVVDDSISVRYSITRLVKNQSWLPFQAVDGIDALERLETLTPDVIILDIEMPRMNGYEFMGIFRNNEAYTDIPVIMLTSRASDKHRKKAEELGVNHYMTKPFQEDDFIDLVRSIEKSNRL
jgi:chemosensory pili system protein ChpA (sensor histidine kinase/response regulator)